VKQLVCPQDNRVLGFEDAQDRHGLIALEDGG
jgi:hypothetical protein